MTRAGHGFLGLLKQRKRSFPISPFCTRLGQVFKYNGPDQIIGAEAPIDNDQRALEKPFGLHRSIRGSKQQRQIVEVSRHRRMVRAEALFIDAERLTIKRLGFGEPAQIAKQFREIVQVSRYSRMIGAEALLIDGKRAEIKWHRFCELVCFPKE